MLINFISKRIKSPEKTEDRVNIFSFFSNNTLSLRRTMLDDIGGYNEAFKYSEDVEICARTYLSRWRMYQSPHIHLRHRARSTLWQVVKQWWCYGYYAVKVYALHNQQIMEIFLFMPRQKREGADETDTFHVLMYKEKTLFNVYVVLNAFWAFHIFLLTSIAFWLLSWHLWTVVSVFFACWFLYAYAKTDFQKRKGFSVCDNVRLFYVRYGVNGVFACASFIGGLFQKTLFLTHIIWDRVEEDTPRSY